MLRCWPEAASARTDFAAASYLDVWLVSATYIS